MGDAARDLATKSTVPVLLVPPKRQERTMMITNDAVQAFLAGHCIAVAGASDKKNNFGRAIVVALADHGY